MDPAKPENDSPDSEKDLNTEEDLNKNEGLETPEAELSEEKGESLEAVSVEKEETGSDFISPSSAGDVSAGVSKLKVAAIAVSATVLGVVGVAYVPSLFEKDTSGSNWDDSSAKVGFTLGEISPDEPVESIVVTLKTGADGDDLNERVEVHLGAGFPFRLFPLGGSSMSPAFAAFSQETSLAPGTQGLAAGESATFEFHRDGENGRDVLESTSKLLKDLTVGDLSSIGFSSLGKSDWILEGYIIEVNGKLFAKHDSLSASAETVLSGIRKDLASGRSESEVLLTEIKTLSSFIATGLASDKDKADLKAKEEVVQQSAGRLNLLAGQAAGFYPWYLEKDEKFTAAVANSTAKPLEEINIRLIAGGGEQPGTRNPLYIKTGGKKFLLTSESDPLGNDDDPQDYTLSSADLKNNPVTREDLKEIGVGLIGNEENFGAVPDRAKLQRIVVTVDGDEVYDSETNSVDRRALTGFWLIPPVHYNTGGGRVKNEEKANEKYLWVSGMAAPLVAPEKIDAEPIPPLTFPPVPGSPTGGVVGTPPPIPGLPALPDKPTTPGSLPGLPPVATPGGTTGTTPGQPGLPPLPGTTGIAPPAPLPGLTGVGGGPKPLPTNPGLTPPSGVRPGAGGLPPRPGTVGGTTPSPGVRTSFSGALPGSFVPTGVVDPMTGLIRGTFQRGNPGFTPIRSGGNSLGGLNPTVFNQPKIPTKLPKTLTQADIAQITTAILNILKPTPAKPTPTTPNPPATIGTVGFPNSMSAVEIGKNTVVDWTLLGKLTSLDGIATFRVDLMPVVPHLSPPIPAGAKPLATAVALASARSVAVPAITMPGTGSFPGVAKTDLPLLYVQPTVTALDAGGKTVGTAKDGPVLPLLPDSSTYRKHDVRFWMQRGISAKPSDDPASQVGGSFQIMRQGGKTFDSWKKLGFAAPGSGLKNAAAMLAVKEEGTIEGIRFAATETASDPLAFNTAVRTRDGDTAILIFESGITYPKVKGKVIDAGTQGSIKGYRVVGHMGFLAGAKGGAGRADVNVRVELDMGSPGPRIVRKKNGDHELDWLLDKTAFFRLESSSPIEVPLVPGGAMQAFDIPISFESLDSLGKMTYPSSRPADSFKSAPFGSAILTKTTAITPAVLAGHLTKPTSKMYSWFNFNKANKIPFGVTVTLMVDTSKAGPDDTLGIFGLRIIPDVY